MAKRSASGGQWRALRLRILQQADYACQLRIAGVCTGHATAADHVIPVSLWPAGELIESNIVAACGPCNRRKSDKLSGWKTPVNEPDPYADF